MTIQWCSSSQETILLHVRHHQWCVHCSELEFGTLRPLSEQSSSLIVNLVPHPLYKCLFYEFTTIMCASWRECFQSTELPMQRIRTLIALFWRCKWMSVVIRLEVAIEMHCAVVSNGDFYSKFIPNRLTALCQGKVLSGKLPVVTDNDRSSDAE